MSTFLAFVSCMALYLLALCFFALISDSTGD